MGYGPCLLVSLSGCLGDSSGAGTIFSSVGGNSQRIPSSSGPSRRPATLRPGPSGGRSLGERPVLTPLRSRRLLPAVLLAAFGAALLLPLADTGRAAPAKGKKYALLVGVKKYKDDKLGDLKYTENDVEELAKLLSSSEGGFSRVIVLTATRGD